jgi:hypothetical protein
VWLQLESVRALADRAGFQILVLEPSYNSFDPTSLTALEKCRDL